MFCAKHPKEATSLTCGRCGIPICSRCTVHTDVGIRCQSCAPSKNVRARRGIPIARTIGLLATVVFLGYWAYWLFALIPLPFGSSGNDYDSLVDEGVLEFQGVVTVNDIVDPSVPDDPDDQPATGRRFVALELTVTNPEDNDGPIYWGAAGLKLTDSNGFAYVPTSSPTRPELPSLELEPGEKTSGWGTFEVAERGAIKSLTYFATEIPLPR
jgi:hypothetical protein